MENASKALIMAAGVLIGVLVLSLAVYLFATFGSTSAELHKQNDRNRINQFNVQFTSYEEKEDITIYDVITVANLATENNQYYGLEKINSMLTIDNNNYPNYYVQVTLKNNTYNYIRLEGGDETKSSYDYNEIIANDTNNINSENSLSKYICKTYISNITEKVYRVDFIEKSN